MKLSGDVYQNVQNKDEWVIKTTASQQIYKLLTGLQADGETFIIPAN